MNNTDIYALAEYVRYTESMRGDWEPLWRELHTYTAPYKGFALDSTCIVHNNQKILDSTATRAINTAVSGLVSGIISPTRPWFRLRFTDTSINENAAARTWIDSLETTVRNVLLQSNFYQSMHSLFLELITFGSATLYIDKGTAYPIEYTCLRCGEFAWNSTTNNTIDTVIRRIKTSLMSLVKAFPQLSNNQAFHARLTKNPYEEILLVHIVMPSTHDNETSPYQSFLYEENTNLLIHEGTYHEFPFITARWDASSSSLYGYSPAMTLLPDIKLLQEMTKNQVNAIQKVINPPMKIPTTFKRPLNLVPGAPNYVDPHTEAAITPLYQINPDIPAINKKIEDIRNAIREGFFTNLFLLFAEHSTQMTAREVSERGAEKLLLLGPMIERYQNEILAPLLRRTMGVLYRDGLLPAIPSQLSHIPFHIQFSSVLSEAQYSYTANTIRHFLNDVATLSTMNNSVLNKINYSQIVDELALYNAIPSRIIAADEEISPPSVPAAPTIQNSPQQKKRDTFLSKLTNLYKKKTPPTA